MKRLFLSLFIVFFLTVPYYASADFSRNYSRNWLGVDAQVNEYLNSIGGRLNRINGVYHFFAESYGCQSTGEMAYSVNVSPLSGGNSIDVVVCAENSDSDNGRRIYLVRP